MSRLYILLIATLCFVTQSMAQEQKDGSKSQTKKSITGIKAGLNLTTFSGDATDTEMQVGANAGIYALYMENEHFGIQPELQYSLQGSGVSNGGHLLMHYLVVPVMLKYYPVPEFSIQAGPYAAFLMAGKYEYEAVDLRINNTKGQDFGFAYGLSFGNEEKLTFNIRHHLGLTSIHKDFKLRNQTVQASLGFCISK